MKNIIYLLLTLLGLGTAACYKDKGNYNYHDINEVMVDIKAKYAVKRTDTTVVIRPGIVQNLVPNTANLVFEWYHNTWSNQQRGELVSTSDTVAIKIDPESDDFSYNHYMRFYITDLITGARYLFPVELDVIKPYHGAWMVLHEDEKGIAKLGSIEYVGDEYLITDDAYSKDSGNHFTGKPVRLGYATYFDMFFDSPRYNPSVLFSCFTDNPDESGLLKIDGDFELYDSPVRFIYPEHYEYFDPADVRYYHGEGRGMIMVCGGHLFTASSYSPNMYRVNPDLSFPGGEYDITHGATVGWTHMAYDSKNRRFVHYYNSNSCSYYTFNEPVDNAGTFGPIPSREGNVSAEIADPNNIPEDQQIVYLGSGYFYGPSLMAASARQAAYGITVSKEKNTLYFYEFHGAPLWRTPSATETDVPFPFYNEVENTMGVTTETPFASSSAYNRLLLFGKDNMVYRYDFGSENGSVSPIYEHPDPNARVTDIETARFYDNASIGLDTYYEAYGHDIHRSFAVTYLMPDGTGEVVVLNLNTSGRPQSIEEHKGFGKITDVVFV